jgi:adenine-specific DNA-methyltransferase
MTVNFSTAILEKDELLINNQNWSLAFKLGKKVLQLIAKIKKDSIKLETIFPDYSQGLIAYDKYQGQSEETIKNRVFHFDSFDKKSGLKKNLWGEDVNRYIVKWNEKEWIDYSGGIANPRLPKYFQGERVLIREITNPRIFAAHTIEELYHDPSIIVILGNSDFNIKFLLSILNSKLLTFYHFNSSPKASKGAFPKILVEDIKNFPIKKTSTESQRPFIDLVDKILSGKKAGEDTQALEAEIDLRVYKLYELTHAEVLVIDPTFGLSAAAYEVWEK